MPVTTPDAIDVTTLPCMPIAEQARPFDAPNKRWKALLADAEITNLRLHDLRRSLGSWAAMQGTSLPIIGKMLGHKTSQATSVYAHLQFDPVKMAMEAATSAMQAKGKAVESIGKQLTPLPPTV